MGAEDLVELGEVWFRIEGVYQHLNRKACGKLQRQMFTIRLLDQDGNPVEKDWWIKATNRKQLTALYGADTQAWEGQWVCLFVTEVKSPEGGLTLGIRIKYAKTPPQEVARPPVVETKKPAKFQHALLDKWRPQFKGCPAEIGQVLKSMAAGLETRDPATLELCETAITEIADDDWRDKLNQFLAAILDEVSKG
jgi:hypothetical protein